jgi:hypothetical protein
MPIGYNNKQREHKVSWSSLDDDDDDDHNSDKPVTLLPRQGLQEKEEADIKQLMDKFSLNIF